MQQAQEGTGQNELVSDGVGQVMIWKICLWIVQGTLSLRAPSFAPTLICSHETLTDLHPELNVAKQVVEVSVHTPRLPGNRWLVPAHRPRRYIVKPRGLVLKGSQESNHSRLPEDPKEANVNADAAKGKAEATWTEVRDTILARELQAAHQTSFNHACRVHVVYIRAESFVGSSP